MDVISNRTYFQGLLFISQVIFFLPTYSMGKDVKQVTLENVKSRTLTDMNAFYYFEGYELYLCRMGKEDYFSLQCKKDDEVIFTLEKGKLILKEDKKILDDTKYPGLLLRAKVLTVKCNKEKTLYKPRDILLKTSKLKHYSDIIIKTCS